MLLKNATDKIEQYNSMCLHYNIIADAIYRKRTEIASPFSAEFRRYIIAGLIAFDMGRMMGEANNRYNDDIDNFGGKLSKKLNKISELLGPIISETIDKVDITNKNIINIVRASYNELSGKGTDGLNQNGEYFHVGATKILHFLNPYLFAIIDSNVAAILRTEYGVGYRAGTQPLYSASKYIESLVIFKKILSDYGIERVNMLEPGTPTMRILDKIIFSSVPMMVPNNRLKLTAAHRKS